jgi:hypothetical protein
MHTDPVIARVFSYFQNLNLLALLEDLRSGRTARGTWVTGSLLCPVAHGMPDGDGVHRLYELSQVTTSPAAHMSAAERIGADARVIEQFVTLWDEGVIKDDYLLKQLTAIWNERIDDAVAVQELLIEEPLNVRAGAR